MRQPSAKDFVPYGAHAPGQRTEHADLEHHRDQAALGGALHMRVATPPRPRIVIDIDLMDRRRERHDAMSRGSDVRILKRASRFTVPGRRRILTGFLGYRLWTIPLSRPRGSRIKSRQPLRASAVPQ
jgi:hypothetical protein